ncbi:MAG TPA: HNH endonuclease [Thermodesulfobacteriota bacterium]|nr:HNH endonuclease [Thermodesulfobacteriota bacterium]
MTKKGSEGLCEMCGHYVSVRQKTHILAEGKKTGENLMMLCPSCHIMFDTHVKPKLFTALRKAGINLSNSWERSIYLQAADASRKARK